VKSTTFRDNHDRITTFVEGRVSVADVESWKRDFAALEKLGCVIAILKSRMVRMGASLVKMISRIPMEIVETRREAEAIIKELELKNV